MNYWIGLDIGTTSTKAVLMTAARTVVATQTVAYQLYRDHAGMAEESPEVIFEAVIATIGRVAQHLSDQDCLCGIGFSAQQHSLILATQDNIPLTRVITWADTRATDAAESIRQSSHGHDWFMRTGTPIQPMAPLAKLLWLQTERPELFQDKPRIMDIKTYIFNRLFGVYKLDLSLASATGLYHLAQQQWDTEILNFLGLDASQLPEIVSPYEVETGLSESVARQLNIPSDTPFIWGAADGPMSNLGVGATKSGVAALTIGTSAAIRVMTNQPLVDAKGRTFTYALDESHWVVGGASNAGGAVLAWLQKQVLGDHLSLSELTTLAATVPAGSQGLIFHPYLGGERAPIWDARATGAFFGLGFEHGQAEMTRAVIEGISYNLDVILHALSEVVGEVGSIQATGGFTQSNLWPQILSDIFELPIHISQQQEAGCLAAVILAQKALGIISEIDSIADPVTSETVYWPMPEHFPIYRDMTKFYQNLLPDYQKHYADLTHLKRR